MTDSTKLYIWRIDNSSFTIITGSPFSLASTTPKGLTFSPDGRYLAVGGASADNIQLYKIDANDTFTALALPTGWSNNASNSGTGFAFAPDSSWVAMITTNTALPAAVFRRTSATTFEYVSAGLPGLPTTLPGSSVAFIH